MSHRSSKSLPNREEWLESRKNSVGGSEAATILGHNPFETPLQLYLQKKGLVPEKTVTSAMKMGHVLEPVIAQLYEEETDRLTTDPGEFTIFKSTEHPDMHATLDRITFKDEAKGVLQIKAPGAHMKDKWDGEVPLYVQIQAQHEMLVSGLNWGSVAALIGGQEFVWDDLERNDQFCAYLVDRCTAFMVAVRNGDPPPAGKDDVDAIRILYPEHEPGKVKELPAKLSHWGDSLVADRKRLKDIQNEIKLAEAKLMEAIGDAETGVFPDGTKFTFKTVERSGYTVQPTTYRQLRRVK